MKLFRLLIVFFFLFQTSILLAQQCVHRGSNGTPVYRSLTGNQRSDTIDVLNYAVNLDITDFAGHTISGFTTVKFRSLLNNVPSIALDLLHMNIDSVLQNGTHVSYVYSDTLLRITLLNSMNNTDTTELTVFYHGTPQMDPSGWGGWYWNGNYSFNLGVGFEALPHNYGRVWHPCFDNFAERATYDFFIKTNNGKRAYANGYLVSENTIGSDTYTQWRMDTPIPTYLAGINVAPYTHVNQTYVSPVFGTTIPVQLTALPGDTSNMKNSFVNLFGAMEAFETYYGPYIWNKVGYSLVPFSSGAMEHATNISYPQATITGNTQYETLMAHELSHHWWGNLLTCETAEHMWINEGMASYSEKLFLEFVHGRTAYDNEVRSNHKKMLWKAHVDDGGWWSLAAMPQAVTYGTTTYDKGSDVIHTMRSYMGDSLFFLGLQTIQANNVLQNLNSTQFRDQLNGIAGVDVTDFFEDWIFNPGWPEFSIDSFHVQANGLTNDVTVYVKQKLRRAPHYYNNVPLNVFFRDANWNVHSGAIVMSGPSMSFTISVPFQPAMVTLNEDERISDAVTGENFVIKTTGLKSLSHANFQITTSAVTDSAFFRVEQHWVGADDFIQANFFCLISPDRYWRVSGIDLENIVTRGKIDYNGTTTAAGYLDDSLMVNHGAVAFHEDSLVLFWRPNTATNWIEYPSYTMFTASNKTDKIGSVQIDSLKAGDYALGIKVSTVGIQEQHQNLLKIVPNPSNDWVSLEWPNHMQVNNVQVFDANGKVVTMMAASQDQLRFDVSQWPSGMYLVLLSDRSGKIIDAQRLVVK